MRVIVFSGPFDLLTASLTFRGYVEVGESMLLCFNVFVFNGLVLCRM